MRDCSEGGMHIQEEYAHAHAWTHATQALPCARPRLTHACVQGHMRACAEGDMRAQEEDAHAHSGTRVLQALPCAGLCSTTQAPAASSLARHHTLCSTPPCAGPGGRAQPDGLRQRHIWLRSHAESA
eukprot:356157-Chlamydomonas_euryale.AAC.2